MLGRRRLWKVAPAGPGEAGSAPRRPPPGPLWLSRCGPRGVEACDPGPCVCGMRVYTIRVTDAEKRPGLPGPLRFARAASSLPASLPCGRRLALDAKTRPRATGGQSRGSGFRSITGDLSLLKCSSEKGNKKKTPVQSPACSLGERTPTLCWVLHSTWELRRPASSDRLCLSSRSWFCLLRSCTSCWAVAWLCLSSCFSLEKNQPQS